MNGVVKTMQILFGFSDFVLYALCHNKCPTQY